ncbi:hypothetical protein BC830DRAFT_1141034 [Chytriomyces sp. MP71]|nr:hypothetical protein BC830DRAFT_1141034 [Chytriomyces sp. MP71]
MIKIPSQPSEVTISPVNLTEKYMQQLEQNSQLLQERFQMLEAAAELKAQVAALQIDLAGTAEIIRQLRSNRANRSTSSIKNTPWGTFNESNLASLGASRQLNAAHMTGSKRKHENRTDGSSGRNKLPRREAANLSAKKLALDKPPPVKLSNGSPNALGYRPYTDIVRSIVPGYVAKDQYYRATLKFIDKYGLPRVEIKRKFKATLSIDAQHAPAYLEYMKGIIGTPDGQRSLVSIPTQQPGARNVRIPASLVKTNKWTSSARKDSSALVIARGAQRTLADDTSDTQGYRAWSGILMSAIPSYTNERPCHRTAVLTFLKENNLPEVQVAGMGEGRSSLGIPEVHQKAFVCFMQKRFKHLQPGDSQRSRLDKAKAKKEGYLPWTEVLRAGKLNYPMEDGKLRRLTLLYLQERSLPEVLVSANGRGRPTIGISKALQREYLDFIYKKLQTDNLNDAAPEHLLSRESDKEISENEPLMGNGSQSEGESDLNEHVPKDWSEMDEVISTDGNQPSKKDDVDTKMVTFEAIIESMMPSYKIIPSNLQEAVKVGVMEFLKFELGTKQACSCMRKKANGAEEVLIPTELEPDLREWLHVELSRCFPNVKLSAVE